MGSPPLHAVLAARRQEVILRWKAIVRGTLAPADMPNVELLDHLPVFLDEVILALAVEGPTPPTTPAGSAIAAVHGEQRLRLGFSLDAVVREYGALRDAIMLTAREAGAAISFREAQKIFDLIVSGIANAVTEYSRQRDAELQRQHNEHFAFIAHELRNPLSSSKMACDQLKRKGLLPPDVRAVAMLERGLHEMLELVDHTLNLARIASGIELRPAALPLRSLLEETRLSVLSAAEEKAIEVELAVEGNDEIWIDRRLLLSALVNVTRNAVKYTPPGGHVELAGGVSGGSLRIEVKDGCGGLPPGKVEEAFAPFVRMNSREGGFGLGLAIAKQAVDAHGGSIRVQNLPGKGCIFVLELPAAPAASTA